MAPRTVDRQPGRSVDQVLALLRSHAARTTPSNADVGLTRAQIQQATGLSRPTVAAAVAELVAKGIVEEVPIEPSGRGRPSKAIRLNTRRAETVGIELGRAHIGVAFLDAAGNVIASAHRHMDAATRIDDQIALAFDLLSTTAEESSCDASAARRVGLGTPGPQHHGADVANDAPVGHWLAEALRRRDYARHKIQAFLGVSVDVGNNVRFGALAEAAAHGSLTPNLLYIRLDQGVGGGIVADGSLLAGSWEAAGEFGHVSTNLLGPRCPCGGRGCLELTASQPALLAATGAGTWRDLVAAANRGLHRTAIEAAAAATAGVLAAATALTDPDVIVVAGSVVELAGFADGVLSTLLDITPVWCSPEVIVRLPASGIVPDQELGAIGAAQAAAGR